MKLPESLSFHEFWEALYRVLLVICNMIVGPKPRSMELVHSLFAAVGNMRESDFLTTTIVISPTSPNPKRMHDIERADNAIDGLKLESETRCAKTPSLYTATCSSWT